MKNYLEQFETELQLRNYCDKTIASYLSMVRLFMTYFEETDPVFVTEEQVKKYLKNSSSTSQLKQRIGALKLFYKLVIRRPLLFTYIQYPRQERRLPNVLSQSEVKALLNACPNVKHLAILRLIYSTGMRISEVINLRIHDIDSDQMIIRVCQAKGKKDRIVPLSKPMLQLLRNYYQQFKPKTYLFAGQFSDKYSVTSIQNFTRRYAKKAGIEKRVHPHLIRHCTATHMLENGTQIEVIQRILGHKRTKTTMIYAHMSRKFISNVQTPDLQL